MRGIVNDRQGINIKSRVKRTVVNMREWSPIYLGHALREDLTLYEYYTLNYCAMEIALMSFKEGAKDRKKSVIEAHKKINTTALLDKDAIEQVQPPIISDLRDAGKIVVFLGNNGEDIYDLIRIQKMLDANPALRVYAVPKGRHIGNAISFEDAEKILSDKQLKGLSDYRKQGRFVLVKNGPMTTGVDLRYVSEELAEALYGADIVITRGKDNFDCLKNTNLNVYPIDEPLKAEAEIKPLPPDVSTEAIREARSPGKRPLMTRTEKMASWKDAQKGIEQMVKDGEQFSLALIDIDFLTKYHEAYGRESKLGGKVRLVINDIINDSIKVKYPTVKVKLIQKGPDETVLLIQGDSAEAVLEDIRKEVILRTNERLGMGYITNLKGLDARKVALIQKMIGKRLNSYTEDKVSVIFDIRQGEKPEHAWQRQLMILNEQLLKKGIVLDGKFSHIVPAFTISCGATESKPDDTVNSLLRDASIALKKAKILRNKVEWSGHVTGSATPGESEQEQTEKAMVKVPDNLNPEIKGKMAEYETSFNSAGGRDKRAILILKGGEYGGLNFNVRSRYIDRLSMHFNVRTGVRYAPAKEEVLSFKVRKYMAD